MSLSVSEAMIKPPSSGRPRRTRRMYCAVPVLVTVRHIPLVMSRFRIYQPEARIVRYLNQDGSLHYPTSRESFDRCAGPYIPRTHVPPIWTPGSFANTMVVNGDTWPVLPPRTARAGTDS
jgi:hypothetical protein